MAYGRPSNLVFPFKEKTPNPVIHECVGTFSTVRDRLSEIELAFALREVLTPADVIETQARLASVAVLLAQASTEIDDPASGLRIKGGRRVA